MLCTPVLATMASLVRLGMGCAWIWTARVRADRSATSVRVGAVARWGAVGWLGKVAAMVLFARALATRTAM